MYQASRPSKFVTRRQVELAFAALAPGLLLGTFRLHGQYRDRREREERQKAPREEQTRAAEADLLAVQAAILAVPGAAWISASVVPRAGDGRPEIRVYWTAVDGQPKVLANGSASDQTIADRVRERVQQTVVRTPVSFQLDTFQLRK